MKKNVSVSGGGVPAQKIAEQLDLFKNVVDAAPDGIQIVGLDGRILYSNKAVARIYGYSAKELEGADVNTMNADPKFASKVILPAIKKNGCWAGELLVKHKKGHTFPILLTTSMVFGNKGTPSAMVGVIHDLTGRKKIEEKLRESEFRLTNAQRITHTGNWEWNVKTNELYWSDENYRIFGIARSVKPSLAEFMRHVHPDDKESVSKAINDALHKKKPYDIDMRIIRPDGVKRIVNSQAEVAFDKSGKPEKMTGTVQDITARKKTEESLSNSEEMYRTLAETAQDMIYVIGRDGVIKYVNTCAAKAIGMRPEEIVGKKRNGFFPEKHAARQKQAQDFVLRTGKPLSSESLTEFSRTGRKQWLSTQLVALKDAGGKINAVMGISRDITKQKEEELLLSESEEKYRTLAEASMDLMWVLDTEGKFIELNRRAEEVSGYAFCELKGKSFVPIVVKKDLPKIMAVFKRVLDGKVQSYEVSAKRKDGSTFLLSANSAPMYSGGKVSKVVSVAEDITLRRKSEDELKSTKKMMQNIAEGITDSVFLLSKDYEILWANAAASRITGQKMSELIGNTCYAITHKRTSPCAPPDDICPVGEVRRTGKAASVIHRHYDKGGNTRFVEVVVYPVRDEEGKITQFVHTSRDITERQKMHDELIRLKLGLERSSDAIFITDERGTITYVNHSFENIYGYKKEEALGKTPRIIKSGLIPKEQYEQFWGTLLAKRIVAGEIINKRKDGELVTIEGSNNPIIDESGKLIGFLSIHHDITNRKKTEEKIQKLSRQNELILTSAGEGIIGLDTGGKMTFVNPAAARMLGYEANELIGKPSHKMWHYKKADGTDYPDSECPIYTSYKDGKLHRSSDEVFWNKGGEPFFVEYASIPIWENGKLSGAVVTFTDITDRKKSYDDIRKLNAELRLKINDLERFNQLTVGRELKMIELKKRIAELEGKKGS